MTVPRSIPALPTAGAGLPGRARRGDREAGAIGAWNRRAAGLLLASLSLAVIEGGG